MLPLHFLKTIATLDATFELEGGDWPTPQAASLTCSLADKWNEPLILELSGAANSTVGSDQVDYVDFRPNRRQSGILHRKAAAGH